MAEQESAKKPRRKRKVLRALVVLLVILIAGFAVFRLVLRSKVNSRLAAIREAGYPATCAELDAWYTIPESAENAADTFIDSFSYFDAWEEKEERRLLPIAGEAELPLRTEPLAQETKALITQYLTDNQQTLELLHRGAAIEYSRYPVDLRRGFECLLPDISNISDGAGLLTLEAVIHAENGKAEQAVDSITSTFGLARSLSKEPIIVSQLVRIACQAYAVSAMEHAINKTEFTDEQFVNLSQSLVNAEDPCAMTRAFAGERCMGLSAYKMPAAQILQVLYLFDDHTHLFGVLAIWLYRFVGLADMDLIVYTNVMNDYLKAIQLPPHKSLDAVDVIEENIKEISKIHILLRFMPGFSRCTTIDVRNAAQLRTAQTGLAIQRYRLATGKLPDSLAELVPTYLDAVVKDPFDGKDLRYKKLETGFVVYSIGEDGSDDGGKERPRKRTGPPASWDVTFIVQR